MSALDKVNKDMQVLVVDDFNTMRKVVRKCLNQLGFKNITEAVDGADALEKLQNSKFELVVSDWNMPNMMGIDLLKAVRADEELKEIPFLMVTAEGKKENVMEAIKSGVSNYVVKPFTAEVLGEKLEAVFAKLAG